MIAILLLAAQIPSLHWDKGPGTMEDLQRAGITKIAGSIEIGGAVKLGKPGVQMRVNEASATRSPWIDSNGWRFLRAPKARFFAGVPGATAGIAAAEAFMFGADVIVQTDAAGLEAFGAMVAFLSTIKPVDWPGVANLGFQDDGTPLAGEALNLLVRKNLLPRVVREPDPRLPLNVQIGTAKYPKSSAANPAEFAQKIRAEITDEKRALRIFGAETVVARLQSDGRSLRVHLLNYASRPLRGFRVRVLGRYTGSSVAAFGVPSAALVDYEAFQDATEFTIPEMISYAVVDLSR
ncbi:MAG: hypothetical protein ACRD44_19290 [Bryobacteraceae bacterium]